MSLVDRPLFQRLAVVLQQLARTAGSKMPAWTGAVALSLTAGWIAAFVYMHSTRRKWRAQQIRSTPQSVSLLKSITASCWREYDAEETGWLEPFEARACLARILQAIEEPHTIAQLSVLIAPQVDSALPTASHDSSSASPSSPASALQSVVCTEVRLILTKLLADLRNRDILNVEFQSFLEHLEARPEKLPQTFTPPIGQKQRREKASATAAHINANGNGSIASTRSDASHSSNEEHKSSSTSRTSSFSQSNVHSASAAATASLDVKIFRYEFTTAVVLWLEAQILRRIFTTEQGGTLAA